MFLDKLCVLSNGKSRSISAENFTGEKGKGGMATEGTGSHYARELGVGWKISPSVFIKPQETFVLADIQGPAIIQSIWISGYYGKDFILRVYYDNQETPSIEVPLCDFFAIPFETYAQINSIPVAVNPNGGLNCFWQMPFKKNCKMTIENIHPTEEKVCYYQINYEETEVPENIAYFHAQYRRVNPLPYKEDYTIVDGIEGKGHYVGTVMGYGINNNKWWGEGEIKFFIDGDKEFPTICGTGTEDYFGGAWDWKVNGQYAIYTTPFMGMPQVIRPDGTYNAQQRHSLYRWHILDPIRFDEDLRITVQALGWRNEARYLPGMHDISSVAYWYQTLPTKPFPKFPTRDEIELI